MGFWHLYESRMDLMWFRSQMLVRLILHLYLDGCVRWVVVHLESCVFSIGEKINLLLLILFSFVSENRLTGLILQKKTIEKIIKFCYVSTKGLFQFRLDNLFGVSTAQEDLKLIKFDRTFYNANGVSMFLMKCKWDSSICVQQWRTE